MSNIIKLTIERMKNYLEIENSKMSTDIKKRYDELVKQNISPIRNINLSLVKSGARTRGKENVQLEIKNSSTDKAPFNVISSGQRSMLAFIIFIMSLEKKLKVNKDRDEIIVIDDPVDSMDLFSYFAVTNMLQEVIKCAPIKVKFIILTHNFEFINTLLFAFFDKISLKKLDYSKELIDLEIKDLVNSDISLIIAFIEHFNLTKDVNCHCLNAFYLMTTGILLAKVMDNYFYSLIEKNLGENRIPAAKIYKDIREVLNNNRDKIEDYEQNFELFEFYTRFRTGEKEDKTSGIFNCDLSNVNKHIEKMRELIEKYANLSSEPKLINVMKKLLCKNINVSIKNLNFLQFEIPLNLEFRLVQVIKAAKIMYYAKTSDEKCENKTINKISNHFRHSPYSMSSPLISFDYDELLRLIANLNN
ncbi:AAA family ATPase [Spiroplasma clarkii]|uniref:AAA family ATPase n=1 Tax=Spiroplasma clarkii TaxID=2139 RepID=UPI001649D083|nr:AAA family ATPase [Spiroplasma clarkii]